ncbi:MAG: hypothetical protein JO165_05100 [Candidatus Eremiobacteraeota bacterium]|nr:hypothetical protein [Candidatus Eremiobacteraeota bacterium]
MSLVHLRELRCPQCSALVAEAGARSFIVNAEDSPIGFAQDDPPAEMVVELTCENGHVQELNVPNEISAEETLSTPDDAPIAVDAVLTGGTTEGGRELG